MTGSLLNTVFWDFRYRVDPELGSGIGSRGDVLEAKRKLIADVSPLKGGRVIDVGCGDLEATRHLPVEEYLGVDVAATAVQIAKEKRPDWCFRVLRLGTDTGRGCNLMFRCFNSSSHGTTILRFDWEINTSGWSQTGRERV